MPLKLMGRFNPIFTSMAAVALGATAAPPDAACSRAVEDPASLHTAEIADGYKACKKERRDEDAAFLLLLGKIRATTDFAVLPPAESVNILEDRSLAPGLLLGSTDMDPDFSRDVPAFDRVVSRVREARLVGPPEHAPGWEVAASAKPELYDRFLAGIRESVLATESYLAHLLRDDRYYRGYIGRREIVSRLHDGDQLDDRYNELGEQMRRVVDELGEPPSDGSLVPWRLLYEPGPQSGFAQLYTGANGPADSSTDLFFSEEAVRSSWLVEAIEPAQLDAILLKVDFEQEVMVSYNVGTRLNATSHAYITDFGWDERFEGYGVDSRVGVVGEECGLGVAESHPFLLAKTRRVREGRVNSTSMSNYPDECAPLMRGTATSRPPSGDEPQP